MPMSKDFASRLLPDLGQIVGHYGTPFHIYDGPGIINGVLALQSAFAYAGLEEFREYYAVKANPNLEVLKLLWQLGVKFDCSSIPELKMVRQLGATGEDIMFTSNDTSDAEFAAALGNGGCILNLDDISLIDRVEKFPDLACFRYNPGKRRTTTDHIIGTPWESKYGVPHEIIVEAYRRAKERGATRFGLHTMIASNCKKYDDLVETVRMLLDVVRLISDELGIVFEFINMGGGLGIPYHPEDEALPLGTMAAEIGKLFAKFFMERGWQPRLYMESGRWVTGPHGVLVTTCINKKDGYIKFRGVDACCLSSMMRPAIYWPDGGYHHITVHDSGKEYKPLFSSETVNIVGPACENADQFGRDRSLPVIQIGDLIIVHDTGAHCYAMASNYNGRLRPMELLYQPDNSIWLIRRAETYDDYLATQKFNPDIWHRY